MGSTGLRKQAKPQSGCESKVSSANRKKLIQEYYSARAKDYDRQKSRTWGSPKGFGDEVSDVLLATFVGFKDKLVLEIGVGSGRNALPLLEEAKLRLVGLDLSREMLEQARAKASSFKQRFDLVLGDADHMPFVNSVFDAIVCMSTMHYFESKEEILGKLSKTLVGGGILAYGDLTVAELDDEEFFEGLERTVSKAHSRYCKPSEMRRSLEAHGFRISKMKIVAYRKTYDSLMEDKGVYFGVPPDTLRKYIQRATAKAKAQYDLTDTGLTLFYTMIIAQNER